MKKSIGCIIAALGIVLANAPAWALTVDETTGKGAFQDNAGDINSVQFKAGVDDTGNVFGQLQDTIQVPGAANVRSHGTVTCFDLLAPNIAVFGGVIDSSTDPSLVGQFFEVEVIDNSPDQIGIDITKTAPDCQHVSVKTHDLLRGSLHVQ
jgi:hypothetical protein